MEKYIENEGTVIICDKCNQADDDMAMIHLDYGFDVCEHCLEKSEEFEKVARQALGISENCTDFSAEYIKAYVSDESFISIGWYMGTVLIEANPELSKVAKWAKVEG